MVQNGVQQQPPPSTTPNGTPGSQQRRPGTPNGAITPEQQAPQNAASIQPYPVFPAFIDPASGSFVRMPNAATLNNLRLIAPGNAAASGPLLINNGQNAPGGPGAGFSLNQANTLGFGNGSLGSPSISLGGN